jgi:hypothetical protein
VATHPGPRPSPIRFPFDAAATLLGRIEDLLDTLETIAVAHDDVLTLDPAVFAGLSRLAFEGRMGSLLTDLGTERGELRAQHDQVSSLVARAHVLQERRAREIASWQLQRDEWQRAQSAAAD